VALAATAFLLLPAAARANEWYGLTDAAAPLGQLSPDQAASFQDELGARGARVALNWDWVQHNPGPFNFSTFDAIYQADLAHGLRPVFLLTGAPAWTWASNDTCAPGGNCNFPPSPTHDSDWQAFVTAVAARYPQLAGIAIWEEPNMDWSWASGPDPARYTQLLRLAYTAVKSVNPSIPVLGGELATSLGSSASSTTMPLPMFLEAMYADGAKGYMDGIAIHPYPQAMSWWYTYKAISTTTQIRDANGDSVPLWITEIGMSTTQNFSWKEQALVDANVIQPLLAYPGIAGVFVNQLMDSTSVPYPNQGYGVLTVKAQPKPAFCDLARVFQTGYHCPLTVSQPQPTSDQKAQWQAQNLLQYAVNAALAYYTQNGGSYLGLTPLTLNAIDPRIGVTPDSGVAPGPAANPADIGIFPMAGGANVLLCNTSQSSFSYCVYNYGYTRWAYGKASGNMYQAAHATIYGLSQTW
jgi:hypothetical protein